MKVLLLPLFTFPTGHSKVSQTMGEWIKRKYPQAEIIEVDLLSYSQPKLEKLISTFYLQWIRWSPKSYGFIYSRWMGKQKHKIKDLSRNSLITKYFERKLYALIEKEKPGFIFCTHSFASKVATLVKQKHGLQIPIINVYTDLFINGVWEVEKADYHIVPTLSAKKEIQEMFHIKDKQIFVTGIPIHPDFTERKIRKVGDRIHVLIAGGNTGLMDLNHLHHLIEHYPQLRFTILCGNNKRLYKDLQSIASSTVHIKSYIQSVKEMNALYDTVDAIISKPGGVTISEVIHKEIPLYISHFLPGPEQVNVKYLDGHRIATCVTMDAIAKEKDQSFCSPLALDQMITQMRKYRLSCSHTVLEAIESVFSAECKEKYFKQRCVFPSVNHPSSMKKISS